MNVVNSYCGKNVQKCCPGATANDRYLWHSAMPYSPVFFNCTTLQSLNLRVRLSHYLPGLGRLVLVSRDLLHCLTSGPFPILLHVTHLIVYYTRTSDAHLFWYGGIIMCDDKSTLCCNVS